VQTAVQISLGGIGAIIGTVSFRAKDAPRFIPGMFFFFFFFFFFRVMLTAFQGLLQLLPPKVSSSLCSLSQLSISRGKTDS
jgi:hypothetical protein